MASELDVATEHEWDETYRRVRPNLVRALVAVSGSYEGVEDAVQEAFLKAMGRATPVTDVEGWLFIVARNHLRRAAWRARLFRRLGRAFEATTRELDMALDRNEVVQCLRQLSERDRALLVAKYYVGMTQQEIATAFGLPRGSVSAAMSRAVARLRENEERRK